MITSSTSANPRLEMFCVFYVDVESSTYNTAHLSPEGYTTYYTLFYDTLSDIASRFGGRVIKHVGDALIIYFPATSDPTSADAFKSAVDCAIAMLEARCSINNAYHENNLSSLSYRISADYGRMECVETDTSPAPDWIGPSMNMVAKMNRLAPVNSMIIGGDLHQILQRFSFQEYGLEHAAELHIGIKQKYPVYFVTSGKPIGGSFPDGSMVTFDGARTNIQASRNMRAGSSNRAGALPNVLIVDDEQEILLVFKQFLSGQPVNVEVFADPVQLLGRLAQVGPTYYDLAILDIRMPKMTGFQVHQILTALKPSIKTLFISALDYAGEVLAGLRAIDKEEDFIRKPVSRESLVCAVNRKIKQSMLALIFGLRFDIFNTCERMRSSQ